MEQGQNRWLGTGFDLATGGLSFQSPSQTLASAKFLSTLLSLAFFLRRALYKIIEGTRTAFTVPPPQPLFFLLFLAFLLVKALRRRHKILETHIVIGRAG